MKYKKDGECLPIWLCMKNGQNCVFIDYLVIEIRKMTDELILWNWELITKSLDPNDLLYYRNV